MSAVIGPAGGGTDRVEAVEESRIALCLSGGGIRATCFHLGVIVSLRSQGRLGDVCEIYAVSGGSILAAHLAANWSRYTGDDAAFAAAVDEVRAVAARDIRGRILRRWILSIALVLPRLLGLSRGRLLNREYETIFGTRSLRRLAQDDPSTPDVYILSTIFNTGEQCSFSGSDFSFENRDVIRKIDGDLVPLAFALAASSAFPPLFPPIKLTREILSATPVDFPYSMALTDGGVFDNLGYKKFLQVSASGESRSTQVVLSDGSGAFHPDIAKTYRGVISRNVRATNILMRRVAEETLDAALHGTGARVLHISIASVAKDRTFPRAIQNQFQAIRTDLDRFSPVEVAMLMTHGYEVCHDAFGVVRSRTARPDVLPPVTLDDNALDQIARQAALRRYRLLDLRDWTTFLLLGIVLAAASLVLVSVVEVLTLRQRNSGLEASNEVLTERTDALSAQVNQNLVPVEPGPVRAPPAADIARASYKVWIQFAGFDRPDVVDLARALAKSWGVQDPDRGGERLKAAVGLNEVRFGDPADEAAARLLASEVETDLKPNRTIAVRQVRGIKLGSLEIWISQ